jgi:pyruvate-formate lyase-activating enzyme
MHDLYKYDVVMLTGGEPMLYPEHMKSIIKKLRHHNPNVQVFLYTALYTNHLKEILPMLDGIHFTLHINATQKDIEGFEKFQDLANRHQDKSIRAYIDPAVTLPVKIYPWLYTRLEVKPWILEGDCPLPNGEDLLYLRS